MLPQPRSAAPASVRGLAATLAVARPALTSFAAMGVLWGAFAAVLPDTKAMLGVDEAQLGLLLIATPVAALAAMFVSPLTGSALGRVALPAATLAMALAFALTGQASALWVFALAMAACGATTGTLDVLMNARVSALEVGRGLHLMNLSHAAYSFGYAGAAIATGLARAQGFGPGAVLGGAAAAAICFALLAWERDGRIEGLRKPPGGGVPGLGAVPLIGGAIVMIAFLSENAAEAWSALHIEHTLGGTAAQGAMGPAVLALTMGLARLAGQGLLMRIDGLRMMRWGAVLAGSGALIAAAAASPAMAYAGFVVMGLGASVIAPTAFSIVGRLAAPEARARAVARATMLGLYGLFLRPADAGPDRLGRGAPGSLWRNGDRPAGGDRAGLGDGAAAIAPRKS